MSFADWPGCLISDARVWSAILGIVARHRVFLGVAVILWLTLLAYPEGRANFVDQVLNPGITFLHGDGTERSALQLPPTWFIQNKFRGDPKVEFGLIDRGQNGGDDEEAALDALIARYPDSPVLIANRLSVGLRGMELGRGDNPISDPLWPKPQPVDPSFEVLEKFQDPQWRKFLQLARHGAKLEPGNTFFDWMQLAPLVAERRDAEALQVLRSAATKHQYDDHEKERILATLDTYRRIRPLTPVEETVLSNSVVVPNVEGLHISRSIDDCLVARIIAFRLHHQDQAAVTDAISLMRLGRVRRLQAFWVPDSSQGRMAEADSIREVYLPPPSPAGYLFAHMPKGNAMLATTTNLAGYALSAGRPEVAREVVAEAADLNPWRLLTRTFIRFMPGGWWGVVADVQERWGRLLLHTLPGCLALLLLATFAGQRLALGDPKPDSSPGSGLFAGATVLVFLAAGDAGIAWRSSDGFFPEYNPANIAESPGLLALSPVLVFWAIPVTFIVLALSHARHELSHAGQNASRLKRFKAAFRLADGSAGWDLAPLVRLTTGCTTWLICLGGYAYLCLSAEVEPSGEKAVLFAHANLIAFCGVFTFLTTALYRWSKLSDRRQALALAIQNVRRLLAGYLLAALLIYPLTALLAIPAQRQFDREFRTYIQDGEVGTLRKMLGM